MDGGNPASQCSGQLRSLRPLALKRLGHGHILRTSITAGKVINSNTMKDDCTNVAFTPKNATVVESRIG